MKALLLSLIFLLPIFSYSEPTPWETKFNNYIKGLPAEVAALLKRTEDRANKARIGRPDI